MSTNADGLDLRWPDRYGDLPKEVFHRDDIYRRELERIFYGPEWHPLAHEAEIPGPGDYKTLQIGEAPVLVLRGDDGKIRVFFNSCPHRGTQLETRSRGRANGVTCPYHRWSFDNCGALLAAPGIERFPAAFRKEDYGLRALRSATACGIVFATCDTATPDLETWLGEGQGYLAKLLGEGGLTLLGYQKVLFSTNWKEYGDNEGYHAPLLHRAFRMLQWQGGSGVQCVTASGHKLIEAELGNTEKSDFLDDSALVEFHDPETPRRSIVVNLFPMTVLTRHLDVINLRYSFPRGPDETEVQYAYFARAGDDAGMWRHRLHQASNLLGPSGLISLEDGAVFNRLHRGSSTLGTVGFQKGVAGRLEAPCYTEQNDEASNLLRWRRYREIMGFGVG
jgi:anthranilate 1,2-dioxygenase large subunit